MARGTFSEAGFGTSVVINSSANLSLKFSGTGSVTLQRFTNGTWNDIPGGTWTEGTEDII